MKYLNLFLMAALSFICMYILMYAMVDEFANVYSNLNQLYMAGLMTIPMIVIELILMRHMYTNKLLNNLIIILCIIAFIVLFVFIRRQYAINDKEFLKSMIPHHAGALLMCKHVKFKDPELEKLCAQINKSQAEEIAFMRAKLKSIS